MLYLRIQRRPDRHECLTVPDHQLPFTVGRDRENKLQISSSAVSRLHAVLYAEDGDYYVQDMESTNGTLLNGRKTKHSRLSPGDTVTVGDVDIVVEAAPPALGTGNTALDLAVSIDTPTFAEDTMIVSDPAKMLAVDEEAPEDISHSYAALRVLYRADQVLRDLEDYRQMLERLMALMTEVMPVSHGYILLLDRETGQLAPYVRHAPDVENGETRLRVSKTIMNAAVERKESILSRDALVDERFSPSQSIVTLKVQSAMCAPLVNRGTVLGVIYLDSTDPSCAFDERDLALLSAIAQKAGVAVDNARLYGDLRSLFFNTVETLVRAIQARDPYTSGHSARVSRYCLLIADRMKLGTRDKHHLYLTSMLHDIGKIGIPDELLHRPGKLSDDELCKVREHVKVGAGMLRALGEMHPIVPFVLHHHEAWDGSGYPDGLKGEQIPLVSRIVAVADTYDAMTSDRPYRKARTRQEAVAELQRCAGQSFDPKVVAAFLAVLDEHATAILDIIAAT